MHSHVQRAIASVAGHESSPDEEGSSSLEPTPACEGLPDQVSEFDDGTRTTAVCVETPIEESAALDKTVIHARAYQIEMFEKSLKQNIIVAVRQVRPIFAVRSLNTHHRWIREVARPRCKSFIERLARELDTHHFPMALLMALRV